MCGQFSQIQHRRLLTFSMGPVFFWDSYEVVARFLTTKYTSLLTRPEVHMVT